MSDFVNWYEYRAIQLREALHDLDVEVIVTFGYAPPSGVFYGNINLRTPMYTHCLSNTLLSTWESDSPVRTEFRFWETMKSYIELACKASDPSIPAIVDRLVPMIRERIKDVYVAGYEE